MDLDTTEKTVSVIASITAIGGAIYAILRVKIDRFARKVFRRSSAKREKQCPRCRAQQARAAVRCSRCGFQFVGRKAKGSRRRA